MVPIRRPRTLRRIAAAMLVFWLFAISVSWANACVLQDRKTHAHADASGGALAAAIVMAGHGGAVPLHGNDAGADDLLCLDLCDATSQTRVQPDATPAAVDLGHAPLLLLSVAWTSSVARLAGDSVAAPLPVPDAIPPRTRLSRLAL
ncbi:MULTISPECIES: hypothetical protein [Hydrogenophaga]|jgi:hypothetical protein|uniref:Uncharacterized protein n=1 Tax=Hydrogenophaga crocea TaxID=2716225 RepID=A0A6G8IK50_9BURK|nr:MULTISPECIES: hypothetical protein [Hydrogenophaga]QIM53489.1 hypothetical protein G9Q37_15675 [Hydrogenophaga crocea]